VVTLVSRTIGLAIIAALVAVAGVAAAQDASFELTLDAPDETGEMSPGDSTPATVDITLKGDGFSCADDEELPVELSVMGTDDVTATANPSNVTFSNTMGVHASDSPAGGYNETGETTVNIQVDSTARSGTNDVTVSGEFPGGNYGPTEGGSCSGEFQSASDDTTITVDVQASGTGTGGDGGNGTGEGNMSDGEDGGDGNGIPVGPCIAPVALIVAGLALRRE
jgi:hypothetical protein